MAHETPAIETNNLRKEYPDTVAVNGISLSVDYGTIFGLLGPNGAGKTTTMRMLTTLTQPTAGTARIDGIAIEQQETVRSRIGFLPENPPIHDELSGREQLEYVAKLRDVPPTAREERIETYLNRLDLDAADSRISTYSKGMRQKIGLIQTLLHEPNVVFLDEPTSGLDPRAAKQMQEIIEELAAEETTIVLSTHILPVVDKLADRVGVVHDGDFVAEAAPDEIKSRAGTEGNESLEDAFLSITRDSRPPAK
ncbi:ABC transporter ATP-binding protein [Haloarcula sp. S1CR25-12]|uniref:ABC transporter ATP-binding protein n=1 Tax=Haloarcula saliterrae TaxID=2950534 RepID=A0ABU2FFE0_9EURY|nr:ABC transporter ATP-binding protein [Haloarcula sp. S1CR25-12]MDS0260959.1 ABC transporter ATP-binding protein [Haloarcula sp. S1CR25-12]